MDTFFEVNHNAAGQIHIGQLYLGKTVIVFCHGTGFWKSIRKQMISVIHTQPACGGQGGQSISCLLSFVKPCGRLIFILRGMAQSMFQNKAQEIHSPAISVFCLF